jgi:hypothetical protein
MKDHILLPFLYDTQKKKSELKFEILFMATKEIFLQNIGNDLQTTWHLMQLLDHRTHVIQLLINTELLNACCGIKRCSQDCLNKMKSNCLSMMMLN